jgi:GNAT superfamily N-acetyltransferase
MSFRCVEENLRESFRVLANGRPMADVMELPGASVASLGVTFQMFNAVFLNAPVESQEDLDRRLRSVRRHFENRRLSWSFWCCEDWLPRAVRRSLSRICGSAGLRLASEMPGMAADRIAPARGQLPGLDIQRVETTHTLNDFRAIGSTCFNVPIAWFSEVFNDALHFRKEFVCWVGYADGLPVATAASVNTAGAVGLYNVATLPLHREKGYGEAVTRHAIRQARLSGGPERVVLESTSDGLHLYQRMGFKAVTRILVYNSK